MKLISSLVFVLSVSIYAQVPRGVAPSSGPRLGSRQISSGQGASAPSDKAFLGKVISIQPIFVEDEFRSAKITVLSESGLETTYTVLKDTKIMKNGGLCTIKVGKAGDTCAGVMIQNGPALRTLTFSDPPKAVTTSPEESKKRKEAAEANALKWHQQLADKGDPYGQYRMGVRYLKGDGVTNNVELARDYLSKSAAQGYADASAELLKMAKPKD
jgi:TPR repeat protein